MPVSYLPAPPHAPTPTVNSYPGFVHDSYSGYRNESARQILCTVALVLRAELSRKWAKSVAKGSYSSKAEARIREEESSTGHWERKGAG